MMKKNTFLNHLEALTKTEVRKFGIYLASTYPNSNVLLDTYQFYVSFHNRKKSIPELAVAHEAIFGRPAKSDLDIRNLQNGISDLFKKLKEYLIMKKVMESDFDKEYIWLQVLEERNLSHQKKLHFNKIVKEQKKSTTLWSKLNELKLLHHELFRNDLEKENPDLKLMEEGVELLDDFYLSLQLKYSSELLNRKNQLSIPPRLSRLFNPIHAVTKKNLSKLSLQNQLYFHLYRFLKSPSQKKTLEIKTFLFRHSKNLHREEKMIALIYLLNFLSNELKKKNYGLREYAVELYEFGLKDDKILIHKNILDHVNFRNIVNLYCHLKAFSKAENFIKNYQQYLNKSIRTENLTIARSMLFFEKGEYRNVIQTITKSKISGVFYVLMTDIYLLASRYELRDTDDIDIYPDSFIRSVRRSKKLGEGSKEAAKNFGKILNYLLQRKISKKKIQQELDKANPVYFGVWLKKKISQYTPI